MDKYTMATSTPTTDSTMDVPFMFTKHMMKAETVTTVTVTDQVPLNTRQDWETLFYRLRRDVASNNNLHVMMKIKVGADVFFSNVVELRTLTYDTIRHIVNRCRIGDMAMCEGLIKVSFFLFH